MAGFPPLARWGGVDTECRKLTGNQSITLLITAMPISKHFSGRQAVRWGIIGCGDVTEVKSGPGFQKAAGSQLVAVMRRSGGLAADYARRHGVPRRDGQPGGLIAGPDRRAGATPQP